MESTKTNTDNIVKYDLHIHSSISDGTFTPYEIIEIAIKNNLKGISITDHDDISIDSIDEYAKKNNLIYIYGIEFSTEIPNLHIIGYNLDLDSPPLKHYLEEQKFERIKAIKEMCRKTQKMGVPVYFEELQEINTKSFGRPHLADAMVKKGYAHSVYDAFQRYLRNDRPIFVDYKKHPYREILNLIHKSNGFSVLAHPAMLKQNLFQSIILSSLKNNLKGIEVYYPRHNESQKKQLKKIASDNNLIITGGSDFHGSIKPDIELGVAGLNEEEFEKFLEAINKG